MSLSEPSRMQKPLLTEAVMFFSEQGVSREMLYPEFEALLDGMVSAPECADESIEAVFLQINHRLHIRAAVFFTLDFDLDGYVNRLWNMPLRSLAEKAARGPDLGSGPIRLVCLGYCAQNQYRPSLWKPAQRSGKSDLAHIAQALTRNSLGIIGEEEEKLSPVATKNLQLAAEERWYENAAALSNPQSDEAVQELKAEIERLKHVHAEKTSGLQQQIEELQKRLTVQESVHIQQQQRLRAKHDGHLQVVQGELLDVKQELVEQQRHNGLLRRELSRLQSRTPSNNE